MMSCAKCGNDQEFITELYYLHWARIDADWKVKSVNTYFQGDTSSYLETDDDAYVECAACGSTDITYDP